jgi:hypothetical protein
VFVCEDQRKERRKGKNEKKIGKTKSMRKVRGGGKLKLF